MCFVWDENWIRDHFNLLILDAENRDDGLKTGMFWVAFLSVLLHVAMWLSSRNIVGSV